MSEALGILNKSDRRKLIFVVLIQTFLGFLDLAGVAIIGTLGALSIQGIESHNAGNKVSTLLKLFRLQHFTLQAQVAILGIIAGGILLVKTVSSIFFTRKIFYFLSVKCAELTTNLIEKILAQNLLEMQKRTTQEILYIVSEGVRNILLGILGTAVTVASDMAMLVIMTIGLFSLDPVVALSSVFLFAVIGYILFKLLQVRAKEIGIESNRLNVESNQKILEVLSTYRESVVRHRRRYYSEQIGKIRYRLGYVIAEQNFQPYISKYVLESASVFGSLLLAGYEFGTKNAVHAVATLAVFIAASSRIAPAALRIQQGLLMIKTSAGSADSTLLLLNELKSADSLIDDDFENAKFDYPGFNPEVIVAGATFQYPGDAGFSLKYADFHVKPGTTTAIVGPSGAGKTTLIDLLIGVLNLSDGSITISGVRPGAASLKWPGAISYLPQNISIVSGSVRENVAMGYSLEVATDDRVWSALDIAQLGNLVRSLPLGLDTQVGETGSLISGGQRQRLGIARALFTSPKLLVMDEATSALDGATELQVAKSIEALSGSVTKIIVAHRLSTVRNADQILYMDKGLLVAKGTFEEVRNQIPDFDHQASLMGL